MIRTQVKVLHYAKNANADGWAASGTEITDFLDFQAETSIEVSADTFQFPLKETTDLPTFRLDDRIDFFVANTASGVNFGTTASDYNNYFVFNGTIEETNTQTTKTGERRIVITGANSTQVLLRMLLPQQVSKTDQVSVNNVSYDPTVPRVIQSILEFMNQNNPSGRQIIWSTDNLPDGYVKSDGTAFPSVSYSTNYKPVYQIFADLSRGTMTGDGDYYFYMKVNSSGQNEFVWRKKEVDIGVTDSPIEGTDFSVNSIPYGAWDLVNNVIVHCGQDAYNHGILTHYYGVQKQGRGTPGLRSKYVPTSKSGSILLGESMVSGSANVFTGRFPLAYPFWTKWQPIWKSATDNDGALIGDPHVFENNKFYNRLNFVNFSTNMRIICNSDSDFNFFLRHAAQIEGKKVGKDIVEAYGFARYKLNLDLYQGSLGYTLGGLYKPTVTSYGWIDGARKVLRLTNIKHSFGRQGWNTTLEFEMDWRAVSAGL